MPKKVVVAMSGGVDSSVAAALLKEQGHEVIGVTLKTRNWDDSEGRKFGGCCGSSDFYDARSVAQTLDIPHYNFDYVEQFRVSVIGYFKNSYVSGETPNPCIACNQFVKFDQLLAHAQALGADALATGHYARVVSKSASSAGVDGRSTVSDRMVIDSPPAAAGNDEFLLRKAVDSQKDQSYVLYHLGQFQLSKLMFPVGDYEKPAIREMARKYGLATADKPDSQEICFIPNNDYRQFLTDQVPESSRQPGPIRHVSGMVLGQHQGLPFYTVGQRTGLGVTIGSPLYVVTLEKDSNTLVVGGKDDVLERSMRVREVTWVSGEAPDLPIEVSVKIRYKHVEAPAVIKEVPNGRNDEPASRRAEEPKKRRGDEPTMDQGYADSDSPLRRYSGSSALRLSDSAVTVTFKEQQSAITPGQAAVFYRGDTVLGGGVIDHVF